LFEGATSRMVALEATSAERATMRLVSVAAAALNQTALDWDGNRERIVRAIEGARERGASLLCLPELCITGYGCEDAFQSPDVQRRALEALESIAAETNGIAASVGLPVMFRGALYNASCLIADGRVRGFVAKGNLAGDGVHYEPRWFKPWPRGERAVVEYDGREIPFGDVLFDCDGIAVGFEICEDAWVADRPGRQLARRGADIILNPSASHFAFDKQTIRKRFVHEGSRAFGVTYVYANQLGNEAGRIIYDGGTLVASSGDLVAAGPRFSYRDVELVQTSVDVEKTRMERAKLASFSPDPADADRARVTVPVALDGADPPPPDCSEPSWMSGSHRKEEEFTRAVSLGLFDYLRKSGTEGFVVSLSGGADSSATATLVAQMVGLGVEALGREGFCDKLDHLPSLHGAESTAELVERLLTCVYQSTRNSSERTRSAAETVAGAIGAEYLEIDVDSIVETYTERVEDALGRQLDWATDDIALQNIQARARGPGIWMIANVRNALLLATSNRSEAAVGYTTMDGDTCGGLSPIAGIDKAFLRRWLAWMRDHGPEELDAIPDMEVVTAQQPTAELRPQEADQTDEGDLMPYELLDAVERAAIRDKRGPLAVLELVRNRFGEYDDDRLQEWVDRFFRLWSRNQWKRERYAPSFHLDDENLDPKTWCRFPILSGGFERELSELEGE